MSYISQPDSKLEQAIRLISQHRKAIVFTGAGMSTASGIPDFRTQTDGLWTKHDPMDVASLSTFHRQPEKFFQWLHPLAAKIQAACPNDGHKALAALESSGYISAIITQNIDSLHQAGGARNVIELHGSLREFICLTCNKKYPGNERLKEFIEMGEPPKCPQCSRILKPGIILFEEMLPMDAWNQADEISKNCKLMIVIGTSLEVEPAASIPRKALKYGAKLIIINQSTTHLDEMADIVINNDQTEILPAINGNLP